MTLPSLPALLLGGAAVALFARYVWETIALQRAMLKRQVREYDMPAVASYHRDFGDGERSLPDRAWVDLDLDAVFQRVDRTASWPGLHMLYARVRQEDHSIDALRDFERAVGRCTDDDGLRERIRVALQPLDGHRASRLPALFAGAIPALPAFAKISPLLTVLSLGMIAGALAYPPLILGVLAMTVINVIVRMVVQTRMDPFIPALRALAPLLRVGTAIASLDVPELRAHTAALHAAVPRLRWIGRTARWLSMQPAGGNELPAFVSQYVNLLVLLDVSLFMWSVDAIRERSGDIRRAYESLGEIDVIQSVASLRAETPRWCRPEFRTDGARAIAAAGLVHPLLEAPVANALELEGRNIVLTGSNMSGKSTFIRTVGVNAVLAGTIHTVFAASWRAPKLAVRTSIGRADSLLEGKSYYRAEVDAVGALFSRAGDAQRLVLIDELFRGTNAIERIAAAVAVLDELDRGDSVVIVATHDVELIGLLPSFAPWHFREEVRDGALTFDYQLHAGACSTRNALAILALAGFPASVIAAATKTAAELEQRFAR